MTKMVIALGKGQLALMLSKAAKNLQIPFESLSLDEAWNLNYSPNVLVTFEQEHVDEPLLHALRERGFPAFPAWETFFLLKSKRAQKIFLAQHNIPSSPFLPATPWSNEVEKFSQNNAVLKSGKGGYDGKGVWLIQNGKTKEGSAKEIAERIQDPYIEKKVDFEREAAAVVCRSSSGEVLLYPTVKSIQQDGICFQVEYTKEFAQTAAAQKAGQIASTIAEKLNYVGVLAVECFITGEEVLVNEIAPRVHNSGHFTIDVCAGSQFENHLRAGLGLTLKSTAPTHPAALMVNLLWPPEEKEFAPLFTKLTCGPAWPEQVKLHWYGKSEPRPKRKMGHFTVYGKTIMECRAIADQILASRWA